MEIQPSQSEIKKQKKFIEDEASFRGTYSRSVFDTLAMSYRSVWRPMALLLVLGFFGRVLLLSNANLIGFWADSFCQAPAKCMAPPAIFSGFGRNDFLSMLIVVTALGYLLTLAFRIGVSRMSAKAVSLLYDEVTLRTSRWPMKVYDTTPVGRIITRFSSDYGNIFRLFGGPLAEFFNIIFDLVAILMLIVWAHPYFMPIFLFSGFLNYGVFRLNASRLRVERRQLSESRSPSIAHFAETAQGASTIRLFSRQSSFVRRFTQLNDRFLKNKLKMSYSLFWFSFEMGAISAFLMLLTGALGYWLVSTGRASIGSVGVAFSFVTLTGTNMQLMYEWIQALDEAMTGVERLDNYLRRPIEPGLVLPQKARFPTDHPRVGYYGNSGVAKEVESKLSAGVKVEGLWLRYGTHLPYVLKDLSFQVKPGEHLGVIGRTGSGKTSLIQALLRLYPIEKGKIEIDGKSPVLDLEDKRLETMDLELYRQKVALISQEPILFRGTLRENLSLDGRHGDDEIVNALKTIGLQVWYEAQAEKLGTAIEERGRNLSLGERQLICMARCLLQNAPVVIMDEATSSVDPQSEELLVQATEKFFKDRTQIIIAHRLSTLKNCDRILWLQNGELVMLDTPEKVLPAFRQTELSN